VLDGLLAARSVREIAADLFGPEAVEDWHPDNGVRAKTRRRIDKAVALRDGGYRDLAAGRKRRRRRAA